jgi:hypothetical protein
LIHIAFGLRIDSTESVPGLAGDSATSSEIADIHAHWGTAPAGIGQVQAPTDPPFFTSSMTTPEGAPALRIWQARGGELLLIRYVDGVDFWVDMQGQNVWAKWSGDSTFEDAASYFVGPILGLLLRMRGITCLHASALNVGGRAVLFAGEEGAGKSTIAAALARRGHPVISDDISALEERGSEIVVIPSFPCLSLWPDSATMVFGPAKKLPEYSSNFEKGRLELQKEQLRFQDAPLKLGAVFLLGERGGDSEAVLVEAVDARESLMALVVHSYANSLIGPEMRAREFALLGRIVGSIPVRGLRPAIGPQGLEELCRTIEATSG